MLPQLLLAPNNLAVVIRCDNRGALALAKDLVFQARTKHIEIQHHWQREAIADGKITQEYISIDQQLPRDKLEAFRGAIGLEKDATKPC